jgi:hypothetical protein
LDALRDGGLREVELLGRARKRGVIGDGDESS